MGAWDWRYFVPYREDIRAALEDLQQEVFATGRYDTPKGFVGPHASIEEARRDTEGFGTCSILDMIGVADAPRNPEWDGTSEYQGWGSDEDIKLAHLCPLTSEQLVRLFGTDRPTHAMIDANSDYYHYLDRGLGLYIIVYDGDMPTELLFAGYSYD